MTLFYIVTTMGHRVRAATCAKRTSPSQLALVSAKASGICCHRYNIRSMVRLVESNTAFPGLKIPPSLSLKNSSAKSWRKCNVVKTTLSCLFSSLHKGKQWVECGPVFAVTSRHYQREKEFCSALKTQSTIGEWKMNKPHRQVVVYSFKNWTKHL